MTEFSEIARYQPGQEPPMFFQTSFIPIQKNESGFIYVIVALIIAINVSTLVKTFRASREGEK